MDSLEEYTLKLGRFWLNFNSLELALRLYITKALHESEIGLEVACGDSCPVSHLTNFDSFGTLARTFNELCQPGERINFGEVVALRDALGHGRVTTLTTVPMTVVKFGKPDASSGTVKVAFRQVLTAEYLDAVVSKLHKMIVAVVAGFPKEGAAPR